jgi:hypothetical protein
MKINSIFLNSAFSLGILVLLVTLSNCGKDPEPTPIEKNTQILTSNGGTWTPASTSGVVVNGIDVSKDLFPGFTITFAKGTFTTTGTSPVWLREDTWQFKDETATVITRGQDNKEIALEEISNTQLKLTLVWTETTYSNGRQRSLAGKHEFFLNKN